MSPVPREFSKVTLKSEMSPVQKCRQGEFHVTSSRRYYTIIVTTSAAASRLWRSILAPMTLDPLRLLTAIVTNFSTKLTRLRRSISCACPHRLFRQIRFVGGPNHAIQIQNGGRRPFWKIEKSPYLSNDWTDRHLISHVDAILKNRKTVISRQRFDWSSQN